MLMQHQCLLRYTCTFFLQKHYEACKAHQPDAVCWVLSHHNEANLFPLGVVYEPAKGLP